MWLYVSDAEVQVDKKTRDESSYHKGKRGTRTKNSNKLDDNEDENDDDDDDDDDDNVDDNKSNIPHKEENIDDKKKKHKHRYRHHHEDSEKTGKFGLVWFSLIHFTSMSAR